MSAANSAARQAALLNGKIDDLERDLDKLKEQLDVTTGKMYQHFADSQVDSLRLGQLVEDVSSVKSSIRYTVRTGAAIVFASLFGLFVAIISSGIGG